MVAIGAGENRGLHGYTDLIRVIRIIRGLLIFSLLLVEEIDLPFLADIYDTDRVKIAIWWWNEHSAFRH